MLATIATTVVVVLLSRTIAKSQVVQTINQGWAEYNKTLLITGNFEELNEFLRNGREFVDAEEQKINFILYLLLNNLSNQFYAARSGVLDGGFAKDSFHDYMVLLYPRREYIINLVEQRGYDAVFIKALHLKWKEIERCQAV